MKITVIGSGYVGLITAVCFARVGNDVLVLDVDQAKVDKLSAGVPTIFEEGLEEYLKGALEQKAIRFTTNQEEAVRHGDVLFIAVGTPPNADGSTDLSYVKAVAQSIGKHLPRRTHKYIVTKSTVPPGTAGAVRSWIEQELRFSTYPMDAYDFTIVSNPEFLREGLAIEDFDNPERVIVGVDRNVAATKITFSELYQPFLGDDQKLLFMSTVDAELTKYAANAMLATRISFMNELSQIATRLGANIDEVKRGIGSDSRIGPKFLNAGIGYGGSCFPKDVQSLIDLAHKLNFEPYLLNAVETVNSRQQVTLLDSVYARLGYDLRDKTITLWGLAFKPGTDDVRSSPAVRMLNTLLQKGATVKVFDSVLDHIKEGPFAQDIFKPGVFACATIEESIQGTNALVICTEDEAHRMAYPKIIEANVPVVLDGRNTLPLSIGADFNTYISIGRPIVGKGVA